MYSFSCCVSEASVQGHMVWFEYWWRHCFFKLSILPIPMPSCAEMGTGVRDLDFGMISHLYYCNSLLAGLPVAAIKPLQPRQQTAAARLLFNRPKFSHVTPLFCDLHWLAPYAPPHLQSMVRPHAPAPALCSTTSTGHHDWWGPKNVFLPENYENHEKNL